MHTTESSQKYSYPSIDGRIDQAVDGVSALRVVLKLGIVRLDLDAGSEGRVSGDYWTFASLPLSVNYRVEEGEQVVGVLTISQLHDIGETLFNFNFPFRSGELNLSLPPNLPIELDVKVDVGQAALDLSDLNVHSLTVNGGVGETHIMLPAASTIDLDFKTGVGELVVQRPPHAESLSARSLHVDSGVGAVRVEMPGRGSYPVHVHSGVGEVSLDIPASLAAQIAGSTGLGHVRVTPGRFQPTGQNRWRTPDYHAEAANRADVTVRTGIGEVNVYTAA